MKELQIDTGLMRQKQDGTRATVSKSQSADSEVQRG